MQFVRLCRVYAKHYAKFRHLVVWTPPTYDIVRKHEIVYDMVGLTYDIVYDVTYDVVRTYDVTYDIVRCYVSYTIS